MKEKIKIKKAIKLVGIIAFTATTLIDIKAHASEKYFSGPYIGVGLGKADQAIRYTDRIDLDVPGAIDIDPITTGGGSTQSVIGSLHAGYGLVLQNNVYVAAELRGMVHSLNSSPLDLDIDLTINGQGGEIQHYISFKNNTNLAVLFKGGKIIAPQTALYLIGGVEVSNFKMITAGTVNLPPAGIASTLSTSKAQSRMGWVLGLGSESYITKNIGLGIEYTFTNYGSKTTGLTLPLSPSGSGVTLNAIADIKTRIYNNALLVNLRYHM